jgi:choline-sulfatase
LTAISGLDVLRPPIDLGWRHHEGAPKVRLGYREGDLVRVALARTAPQVPYLALLPAQGEGLAEVRHPVSTDRPIFLTFRLVHCESGRIVATRCLEISFRVDEGVLLPSVRLAASEPSTMPTIGSSDPVERPQARTRTAVRHTASADQPDLVLIMTDQQRFDQLGYDSDGFFETPHIDALASRGVVFERAYSGGTNCIPARVSLLTGLQQHRVPKQPGSWLAMREGFWTIAHELQRAGYATALVGKMHATPIRAQHGFDTLRLCEHLGLQALRAGMNSEDTDDYHDWLLANGLGDWRSASPDEWFRQVGHLFPYQAEFHPTAWVEREALSVVSRRDPNRPLFLVVSFPHPHAPLNPPEPYESRYDPSEMSLPADGFEVNARLPVPYLDAMTATRKGRTAQRVAGAERRVRGTLTRSRALIAQIDDAVGGILEHIDLSKTLVVFTSDHGDYAGHRGLLQKEPWIPFDDLARVPLVVAGLDANCGRRVSSLVQSYDFVPTCLDYANINMASQVLDSRSLRPLLVGSNDAAENQRAVMCSTPGWPMVRSGPYKYIRHRESGCSVLFDLDRDPGETTNVLEDAAYTSIAKALERLLDESLSRGVPELALS